MTAASGADRGAMTAWCNWEHCPVIGRHRITIGVGCRASAASGADRRARQAAADLGAIRRANADLAASGADRCQCRNLADDSMPPSERIGDTEAKRRGLWSTVDCTLHRPASGADQPTLRDQLIAVLQPVLLTRVAEDRADALLPLIEAREERAKAEAAAEALEQAANDWPPTWALAPDDYLRDRAASLRATAGQPPDRPTT